MSSLAGLPGTTAGPCHHRTPRHELLGRGHYRHGAQPGAGSRRTPAQMCRQHWQQAQAAPHTPAPAGLLRCLAHADVLCEGPLPLPDVYAGICCYIYLQFEPPHPATHETCTGSIPCSCRVWWTLCRCPPCLQGCHTSVHRPGQYGSENESCSHPSVAAARGKLARAAASAASMSDMSRSAAARRRSYVKGLRISAQYAPVLDAAT